MTADVRLPQGTRPADGVPGPSSDVSTAEYRYVVGQTTQTPYDRYRQLSYQGHAALPPWGIILPRIWIDPSDLTAHDDMTAHGNLTARGDLTTPQLSTPSMMGPYRILL